MKIFRFFLAIHFFLFTSLNLIFADPNFPGGKTTNEVENKNSFSLSARNLEEHMKINFLVGNALFERIWEDAKLSKNIAKDGLGPFFSAKSCESCHISDGRGHLPKSASDNTVSVVIQISKDSKNSDSKIKNVEDSTYGGQISEFSVEGVVKEADISFNYEYVPSVYEDGRVVQLRKPVIKISNLNYGSFDDRTNFSARIAQPMIGLGLIENISSTDIIANADEDDVNNDNITGKANMVWNSVLNEWSLGRFGWKASQPTVYQQTADAFFHDMGLSNNLHINSYNCSDKQKDCENAIDGSSDEFDNFEVSNDQLNLVTFYSSQLGVPIRRNIDSADVIAGKKIFYQLNCQSCHVDKFVTKKNGSYANLSNQIIYPYSDFLLHDMGKGLADGVSEYNATGQEWRTPPLWGIGLTKVVSEEYGFLHDGRARTLEEAILWHGGEANKIIQEFKKLNKIEVNQLVSFIESL